MWLRLSTALLSAIAHMKAIARRYLFIYFPILSILVGSARGKFSLIFDAHGAALLWLLTLGTIGFEFIVLIQKKYGIKSLMLFLPICFVVIWGEWSTASSVILEFYCQAHKCLTPDDVDWNSALKNDNYKSYMNYISAHKDGKYILAAQSKLFDIKQKDFSDTKVCIFKRCSIEYCFMDYAKKYPVDPSTDILFSLIVERYKADICTFKGRTVLEHENDKEVKDCDWVFVPDMSVFEYENGKLNFRAITKREGKGCKGTSNLPVKKR